MLDHVICEIEATLKERQYRAYVTDVLMTLTNNVAHGLGGSVINVRWADSFKKQDTRTPEEVVRDVFKRGGLKLKGGET